MKKKLENVVTIITKALFIILWFISFIGVCSLVKNSLQKPEPKIEIQVKPPVEINEKLMKLSGTTT
jgi:hypothetical protein